MRPTLTPLVVAMLLTIACGSDRSPTGPSSAPPPSVPTTLIGTVTSSSGSRIDGAAIRGMDGSNSGRSATTNAAGEYRFDGISSGNTNFSATAPGHLEDRRGLTIVISQTNTLNFTLEQAPIFRVSGQGNQVFDVPTYVSRVQVSGRYDGFCMNFILRIGGRLVVNEILGTCSSATGRGYDGTHQLQTPGGLGEIVNSTNVQWTITEVR